MFSALPLDQLAADVRRFMLYRICLLRAWSEATGEVPHWITRSTPTWRRRLRRWSETQLDGLWRG